jgi:hypothetical protein
MKLVEITKKDFLHKALPFMPNAQMELAANKILIPILFSEIEKISKQIPIRFVKDDKKFYMVGVYGIEPEKNVWFTNENNPLCENIPASCCLWPFYLKIKAGKEVVCYDSDACPLDEAYGAEKLRFFDNNGKSTEWFEKKKKYLIEFEKQAAITNFFINQLEKFNLLEEIVVDLKQWDFPKRLSGLWGIEIVHLYKLPDEVFLKLKHLLPPIHHIIDSNYHFSKIVTLINAKQKGTSHVKRENLELGSKIFQEEESLQFDYNNIL